MQFLTLECVNQNRMKMKLFWKHLPMQIILSVSRKSTTAYIIKSCNEVNNWGWIYSSIPHYIRAEIHKNFFEEFPISKTKTTVKVDSLNAIKMNESYQISRYWRMLKLNSITCILNGSKAGLIWVLPHRRKDSQYFNKIIRCQ